MHTQTKQNTVDLKYVLAKTIRVVTIPPLAALFLLMLLRSFGRFDVFSKAADFYFSFAFLVLVPILAYPFSYLHKAFRQRGREGQREAAFLFATAGYFAAMVYAIVGAVSQSLMVLLFTYFLSLTVLSVFNKILKVRASGHACSIAGPLVLAVYFIGIKYAVVCAALFALVVWASLYMKRHTLKELMFGALSAVISFFASVFFVDIAFFLRQLNIL